MQIYLPTKNMAKLAMQSTESGKARTTMYRVDSENMANSCNNTWHKKDVNYIRLARQHTLNMPFLALNGKMS